MSKTKTKKDQFKPLEEVDKVDWAEILTVNNGVKQLNVTRKAFNVVYQSKGYVIGEIGSPDKPVSNIDDYPSDEEIKTPSQKQTQSVGKAKEVAGEKPKGSE